MLKKEIRKIYREKRNTLSNAQRNKLEDLLLIQFQQLNIDIPATIMAYAPIEKFNEYDPGLILDYCAFKNPIQQLCYPLMTSGLTESPKMHAVCVDDTTEFELNAWGIPEPINAPIIDPSRIEMVILPLLAFDLKGNRVGYGKGYYDNFLKSCNAQCIKIGFSYFEPLDIIEDVASWDIPLNFGITPERIVNFDAN
ncbi:MAG: 5-formyltetrahydrofolate cyclo-ligase [Ferruginibacter sp.]